MPYRNKYAENLFRHHDRDASPGDTGAATESRTVDTDERGFSNRYEDANKVHTGRGNFTARIRDPYHDS